MAPGGARLYPIGKRMKYILSSLALSLLAAHAGARADDGEAKLAA